MNLVRDNQGTVKARGRGTSTFSSPFSEMVSQVGKQCVCREANNLIFFYGLLTPSVVNIIKKNAFF